MAQETENLHHSQHLEHLEQVEQVEHSENQNPFTVKKVLTKYEKAVFNYAVKRAIQESDNPITHTDALRKVSEHWSNEEYRKQYTIDFLNNKAEKLSMQLGQLELILEALKE